MKLSEKLSEMISKQIAAEYYSAYLYLSMSAYFDNLGYKGLANWMYVQAKEEVAHGTHMFDHILERGNSPVLSQVDTPPHDFDGIVDVFEKALAHEEFVTSRIYAIASQAMAEQDHATYVFMQWYITEQVEEEASAQEIIDKLTFIQDNTSAMYALDTELGQRVFVDPFAAAAN